MLTWARFLALLAPAIVTACVLPEHGGGNIFVGDSKGTGGLTATGGAGNTQDTGGSVNVSHTGGSPASGGSTGTYQILPTGGVTGTGGTNHSCPSGVAGNPGACVCNGGCAGSGAHIPCPSGWVNPDNTCATIVTGGCRTAYTVDPPYCNDHAPTCLLALPPNDILLTGVSFSEEVQLLSIGAVVGALSDPYQVALYTDVNGRPDAFQMATSNLTYRSPEQQFADPVRIPAGNYWLAIRAIEGNEHSVYLVIDNNYGMISVYTDLSGETSWPSGSAWAATLGMYGSPLKIDGYMGSILHVYVDYVSGNAVAGN